MKKHLPSLLAVLFCALVPPLRAAGEADLFPLMTWEGYKAKAVAAPKTGAAKGPSGQAAVRIEATAKGNFQGAVAHFAAPVDFSQYAALEFWMRHGITQKNGGKLSLVMHVQGDFGRSHCSFSVPSSDWSRVEIPLDKASFTPQRGNSVNLAGVASLRIYPYGGMNEPGKFLEFAGFRLLPKSGGPRPLKAMNYTHLAAPTSGEGGSTLTDGDLGKNVHFRAYSDDPDIVFDLGGRFTVDEIRVHANSAPSHNFSEIAVMLSFDRAAWHAAGTLRNTAEGTEPRQLVYTFRSPDRPMVGRYVRLKAARPRSDFPAELSEVEFTGHEPTAEETARAAEAAYDRGAPMPPRTEKDYVRLAGNGLELWISRADGAVNGVFCDGRLVAERLTPKYTLQTREKDTAVDGRGDRVEKIGLEADGSVAAVLANPGLPGLRLRRTWHIEGNALMVKTEVLANGMKERFFLRLATEVILEPSFRRDGFYDLPGSALAAAMFRLPSAEVQADRTLTNIPTIAFENAKAGLTLWHTRYRANGRFTYMDVGTEEENLQFFRPNGWLLTAATLVPADAPSQSFEERLSFTRGGMIRAYDEYISTPDAKAFRGQIRRPAWLRDLRCDISLGWDANYPGSSRRHIANMTDAFSPRGYIHECAMSDQDGIWGDLPVKGEIRGWFGNRNTAEELRDKVRALRKMNPRLKLGYYTWFWSAFPWSTPVKTHPEWFVRTLRSGAKASWFPGVNTNYLRFFGIRESREEARNQIVNFVNYYEQDNWYLDGGKSGPYAKDWDTMRIDDPLGQTDFYLDVRRAIKEGHPDRVVFFNHSENPLGDLGYLESFGGTLTSEWRRGAILMWKFKLYNYKDPLHHSVYIYWLPGVDGAFHNYMAGVGVVGSYCSRGFSARDLPYIAARYEIRQAQLADAGIRPDWRLDAAEELELMALRQGGNGWLFINPHGAAKAVREVSVETAPLGLSDPSRPIHAWLYTIRDGRQYKGTFAEPAVARAYQSSGWIAERAVVPRYLGAFPYAARFTRQVEAEPGVAQVLMLSQTPAVVVSVAGEPSHYYLAGQPGIRLEGDGRRFTVESEEPCEIGLMLPEGQSAASVTVNGRPAEATLRAEAGMRLAIVPVGKGRSEIELATRPGAAPVATALEVSRKGRTLTVKVAPEGAPVQIYEAGRLALSRTGSFTLELPDTVRDGDYEAVSGGLRRPFTLKKLGRPMKLRPILLPQKARTETAKVEATVRGVRVLSRGTSATEACGYASADAGRLVLKAGTHRFYESHFNRLSAMLEIQARRYLRLRLASGFWFHNVFGYQPKRHSVRLSRPDVFGGLVLDFGTPAGYTVRSAAGLGIQNEKRDTAQPEGWGKRAKQDHVYLLDGILVDEKTKEKEVWIDLHSLGAPEDWDGRLCLAVHLEDICPDRSLAVEVVESADQLPNGAKALKPQELGRVEPMLLGIPRIQGAPDWKALPALGEMHAVKSAMPPLKTVVKAAYDDKNLYFHYRCEEEPGRILNTEGGKINKPWLGDGIEFFVGKTDEPGMIYHVVLDVANARFVEIARLVREPGARNIERADSTVKAAFAVRDGQWEAVVTLPWGELGGRPEAGKPVPFNLMRNRLEQGKFGHYILAPGTEYYSGRQCQFRLAR